jgi:hypothetical protein
MTFKEVKPMLMRAPCIPSEVSCECRGCQRFSGPEVVSNAYPVIDATKAAWPEGRCPMLLSEAV